jgi:hypothetical protein
MELALLGSRFPALARIPFDTNSFRFGRTHVKGGRTAVTIAERAKDWLQYRGRRWYWQRWRRAEPRRYFRLYDVDRPCWQAVRAAADRHRDAVGEHVDRKLLDELLPPAGARIGCADPFGEGAARRTLLGLLLWHGR